MICPRCKSGMFEETIHGVKSWRCFTHGTMAYPEFQHPVTVHHDPRTDRTRKCKTCGVVFEPIDLRRTSHYCGPECKATGKRAQNKIYAARRAETVAALKTQAEGLKVIREKRKERAVTTLRPRPVVTEGMKEWALRREAGA